MVDTLNKLGFACSYAEVQRYQPSAAMSQGLDTQGYNGEFIQFVADNADHNSATLDGHNTFHGMGIIAGITPAIRCDKRVPRLNVNRSDLEAIGRIDIRIWRPEHNRQVMPQYKSLPSTESENGCSNMDLLWQYVWPLRQDRPGWSGFMQAVSKGNYPGKSSIIFMPMIDLDPTNMTCIYSTFNVAVCM